MAKDTQSPDYLELKAEIRSVLISSQQGCDEQQLMSDFASFNGRTIPFRQMGYSNLIELLTSMPDVARIDKYKRPIVIHGVADEKTLHIQKFVLGQRSKKSKKPRGGGRTRSNRTNFPIINSVYGPPSYRRDVNDMSYESYSQIKSHPRQTWDEPKRPQYASAVYPAVSESRTPVIRMPIKTTVASFPPKLSPTPSTSESNEGTPTIDDDISVVDDDITYTPDDELAAFDLQQAEKHGEEIIFLRKRIRQLLLKYPSGLWLSSVHKLYKKRFDEDLDLEKFQLKTLMAFFDCVSDFVDSKRDSTPSSSDRLFFPKEKYIDAIKRESNTTDSVVSTNMPSIQNPNSTNQNSSRLTTNEIQRPIVDLSAFVAFDFRFQQLKYESNEPFEGFLGDVENPWNIHIGNIEFIPKRDYMMAELQNHYKQTPLQSIYVIPFEQIRQGLSCVYNHTDGTYYRSTIIQVDPIDNNDTIKLKIYLVDYGLTIHDINYHMSSIDLKFLHNNFSSLPTEVYYCRLADIHYPPTSIQWNNDAQQFIRDCIQEIDFSVQVVDFINPFYYVYILIEQNPQKTLNQLLVQQAYAIEVNDSQDPTVETFARCEIPMHNNYIDERLLYREQENNLEFDTEENSLKHFIISIDHAYYLIKQPFTKRPCLPCFEVARLLNIDEASIPNLNLIRETEIKFSESYRILFNDLRCMPETSKCPHINRNDEVATFILYDLGSIRDYLRKIKFIEGDVIDALAQEYDNYERPGYWHEKKSHYMNNQDFETHQESLYQRKEILNFRKEQVVSLSKLSDDFSYCDEIQDIDHRLQLTNEKLHSMEKICPSTVNNHKFIQLSPMKLPSSKAKMRETLYRIARPFDQQFSLNVCFDHQQITSEIFHKIYNDDFEERMQDLYRIIKNVIQFCILESETSNEANRDLLNEARQISSTLINSSLSLKDRIEAYNYCFQVIENFQPSIRRCVQRINLMDII